MPTDTHTATLIDISVPIRPGMPIYPGDPEVVFEPALDMKCGDLANVTRIHMGSQTGTHYDAPDHILNNSISIDRVPLDVCYGPAQVIEIPESVQAIDGAVLAQHDLTGCTRLLLKTKNSRFWQDNPDQFVESFAALSEDGGRYLTTLGIQLVGIDYLSIELFNTPDLGAHKALMAANILILEGLNLSAVAPGDYTLIAFPLAYQGLDGAPTRAVLQKSLC